MKELTTKKLKKMSKSQLEALANQYATKLTWLHSTGKNTEDPEAYKRTALELYHISELIEYKENNKLSKKYNYNGKK